MTLQGDAEYKTVVNILWSEIDPLNLYWHINLKEAKVAIMTCIAIAEAVPPELRDDTVIVFGEDNTTALAGLKWDDRDCREHFERNDQPTLRCNRHDVSVSHSSDRRAASTRMHTKEALLGCASHAQVCAHMGMHVHT